MVSDTVRGACVQSLVAAIERLDPLTVSGRVAAVNGLLIEARGGLSRLAVGARAEITRLAEKPVAAEVVGFRENRALLMPFGPVEGVAPGAEIRIQPLGSAVRPTKAWLGRIVDAFGEPIDGKGPLPQGIVGYPLRAPPPSAHARARVGERLDLGVRAMNVFTTCCRGQRLGVFAGSGVGKSVLLSMLAKNADCDAVVVGLIGERGREVREFIEETLGEEGLRRAIVVVATSDEPALKRRQAAYMTMAIAEFLRDQDLEVLCLMDSVTRFAMAQREVGLSAGEPPSSRGYTPSVFALLPRLMERAGTFEGQGSITGIYTVLVEGDDMNEPISDAVRGILDGHVVLSRKLASKNHFPAIDVLPSLSRLFSALAPPEQKQLASKLRDLMATYQDAEDLIQIGAYTKGSSTAIDQAIQFQPAIQAFLRQATAEGSSHHAALLAMGQIFGIDLTPFLKAGA